MEVRYLPLKRGISAILARDPMKTRQMGAIPPLCNIISKGYCAIWGGISQWGAKPILRFLPPLFTASKPGFGGGACAVALTSPSHLCNCLNGMLAWEDGIRSSLCCCKVKLALLAHIVPQHWQCVAQSLGLLSSHDLGLEHLGV